MNALLTGLVALFFMLAGGPHLPPDTAFDTTAFEAHLECGSPGLHVKKKIQVALSLGDLMQLFMIPNFEETCDKSNGIIAPGAHAPSWSWPGGGIA
jgi:hypothetical protein